MIPTSVVTHVNRYGTYPGSGIQRKKKLTFRRHLCIFLCSAFSCANILFVCFFRPNWLKALSLLPLSWHKTTRSLSPAKPWLFSLHIFLHIIFQESPRDGSARFVCPPPPSPTFSHPKTTHPLYASLPGCRPHHAAATATLPAFVVILLWGPFWGGGGLSAEGSFTVWFTVLIGMPFTWLIKALFASLYGRKKTFQGTVQYMGTIPYFTVLVCKYPTPSLRCNLHFIVAFTSSVAGRGMFIPDLGFNLFHPGSGSASASWNLSFLTLKTVSKLSEKWSGSRPDQDSYFFYHPGSGSLIQGPDPGSGLTTLFTSQWSF